MSRPSRQIMRATLRREAWQEAIALTRRRRTDAETRGGAMPPLRRERRAAWRELTHKLWEAAGAEAATQKLLSGNAAGQRNTAST